MRREPIVFVLVLLILGLMAFSLLGETVPSAPRDRGSGLELPTAAMGPIDTVPGVPLGDGKRRDLLKRPSADEPLTPIVLPLPPMGELASLLPPPLPSGDPAGWSEYLLVVPPTLLGGLGDLVDASAEIPSTESGDSSDPGVFEDPAAGYRASYDWVKLDAITTLWGHLLGADRYDHEVGDTLSFLEVDPRTGRERYGERKLEPDFYEDFGFAETLRNRIELDVRGWRATQSPARVESQREFADWLIVQAMQEPIAFAYAEEMARATVKMVPDEMANWMALGRAWESSLQLDHAFALYATLVGEPLPAGAPDLGVEVAAGRFERAAAPRARMGVILRRLGLTGEAEAQLRAAVAVDNSDRTSLLELGLLLLDAGQPDEADAMLTRAFAQHARRSTPDALRNGLAIGEVALRLGDWQRAGDAFAGVIAAGARDEIALQADAGQVAASYLAGDFRGASELASQAVQTHGADSGLLYLRGIAEAASGGSAASVVRDLRASAAASSLDAAHALAALAFWLDRLGQEEEARATLGDALELSPRHIYGRYLAGHWAVRDGEFETARELLQPLVSEAASCVGVIADLSWALQELGEIARASVGLARCEELKPQRPNGAPLGRAWADLSLRHGLVLLRAGRIGEAQSAFERAISADNGLHAARNAQAVALYDDSELDGAIAEFGFVMDALRSDETDEQYLYAQLWQSRVEEHSRQRRWVDEFEGRTKAGWNLQDGARLGVEPRVLDGQLVLEGSHREKGMTKAYRERAAVSFRSFAADLTVGSENLGSAGAYIALVNRRTETWYLRVYRDREGAMQWVMKKGSSTESGPLNRRLATGSTARIQFELDREPTQPILTIRIDGESVWSEAVGNLRNPAGTLASGIYVETGNALPVAATLDRVEMIYVTPKP